MTCIVGWANNEIMVVGGDSAGVAGLDIETRKDPKVFTVKQEEGTDAIIGFTTSFRMGQLLMSLKIPRDVSGPEEKQKHFLFLVKKMIPAVRKILKVGGFSKVSNERETGGTFILAYRGTIYKIESDFQIGVPTTPFASVGCGEAYALGALHFALEHNPDTSVTDIVRKALLVAERCSAGVRSPMNIIEIRLK